MSCAGFRVTIMFSYGLKDKSVISIGMIKSKLSPAWNPGDMHVRIIKFDDSISVNFFERLKIRNGT